MEHTRTKKSFSYHLYKVFLFLYPPAYLRKHRIEMLQNFEDLERDMNSAGALLTFILRDIVISLPIQYVKLVRHSRLAQIIVGLMCIAAAFLAYQVYITDMAHTSFQNYVKFRGCVNVFNQTPTSADCTNEDGRTIKIVEIGTKWYRDGDGPGMW